MTTIFCSHCEDPYLDEESDAQDPSCFCSRDCEDTQVCLECFSDYVPRFGPDQDDGFCCDFCKEKYDASLSGEEEEETEEGDDV